MAGRILRVTRRTKAKVKPKTRRLLRFPRVKPATLATAILLISLGVASYILGSNLPVIRAPAEDVPPTLSSASPAYGAVGSEVTLKGARFDKTGNTVVITPKDGMPGYIGDISSRDRKTIKFTFPEGLDLCPPNAEAENIPCSLAYPQVIVGIYEIRVWTSDGTSNALTFTIIDGEE